MYDKNNIFAKILRSEIPCKKVYEDDDVLFFHDINPVAKIHVLGIPKNECANLEEFIASSNEKVIHNFFSKVIEVAKILELTNDGYRLITNSGANGGQEVPHFHVHIIGGELLGSKIK
tara:strand:+ start:254 stop:607 length:354 start_codon:yes stop_codon:yes gene_type:complete